MFRMTSQRGGDQSRKIRRNYDRISLKNHQISQRSSQNGVNRRGESDPKVVLDIFNGLEWNGFRARGVHPICRWEKGGEKWGWLEDALK